MYKVGCPIDGKLGAFDGCSKHSCRFRSCLLLQWNIPAFRSILVFRFGRGVIENLQKIVKYKRIPKIEKIV